MQVCRNIYALHFADGPGGGSMTRQAPSRHGEDTDAAGWTGPG